MCVCVCVCVCAYMYICIHIHYIHIKRYDPTQPNALHYYNLDALYSVEYHGEDHVTDSVISTYASAALAYCGNLPQYFFF